MGEGDVQTRGGREGVENDSITSPLKTGLKARDLGGRAGVGCSKKTIVCLVGESLNSVDIPGQKMKRRWKYSTGVLQRGKPGAVYLKISDVGSR